MVEVESLRKLQELDLELMRSNEAHAAKEDLQALKKLTDDQKRLSTLARQLLGTRKDLEMEVAELHESRAGYEQNSEEVKKQAQDNASDYRSIASYETKLSDLAKRIEKIDFTLSSKEPELEELKAKEALAAERLQEMQTKIENYATKIRDERSSIEEKIEELTQEREALIKDIPSELYEDFLKAQERFSGLAVEELTGDTPSICRVKLQPSQLDALKASKKTHAECPYCHRILLIEGDLK